MDRRWSWADLKASIVAQVLATFGLGGVLIQEVGYQADLDDLTTAPGVTTLFAFTTTTANVPPDVLGLDHGSGIHFRRAVGGGEVQILFTDIYATSAYIRRRGTNTWSPWAEFWTSVSYPSDDAVTYVSSFSNGWDEASTNSVHYVRRAGSVYLSAELDGSAATGVTVFVLPSGWRPPAIWRTIAKNGNDAVVVNIFTGGEIQIPTGLGATVRFAVAFPVIE